MHRTRLPFIKICCIESTAEAAMAVSAGASALGLVSAMPSGPGVIDDGLIAEIVTTVAGSVETFLLTSKQDAEAIIEQHGKCQTSAIQLVDHVATSQLRQLRERLPGTKLVQVIHVTGDEAITAATAVCPMVDALLLDSGNQNLRVKELGGTGRTHDWAVSRRIREFVNIPVFLAGGLDAGNVSAAMDTVKPYGLDLCSGVRTEGHLDAKKLQEFMQAAAGNRNS